MGKLTYHGYDPERTRRMSDGYSILTGANLSRPSKSDSEENEEQEDNPPKDEEKKAFGTDLQPSHFVLPPTRCALRRDTDGLAGHVFLEYQRLM